MFEAIINKFSVLSVFSIVHHLKQGGIYCVLTMSPWSELIFWLVPFT